jgi:hypothetical protein
MAQTAHTSRTTTHPDRLGSGKATVEEEFPEVRARISQIQIGRMKDLLFSERQIRRDPPSQYSESFSLRALFLSARWQSSFGHDDNAHKSFPNFSP